MLIESGPAADQVVDKAPRIDATDSPIGLPLSGPQLGIWFAQRLNPASAAYNIAQYIEIKGDISAALFERALRQGVSEAEALRVRIVEHDGVPRQVIDDACAWSLAAIDVSSQSDPRGAAEAWMRDDLGRAVDPTQGPLFRFALFKAADDLFFWYARYHHIVADGFTMWLIARRVAEIYTALSEGRSATGGAFGPLQVLLDRDAAYRGSDAVARDREFWAEQLKDRPDAARLGDARALSGRTGEGAQEGPGGAAHFFRQTGYLDEAHVLRLRALAQTMGMRLPHLLAAATAMFVHRMTGERDIIVGLPVAARDAAARNVPGMVSNVIPLRVAVGPGMTVGQVLGQVAATLRPSLPHQQYLISEFLRDAGGGEHGPMFGVSANIMRLDHDFSFAGRSSCAVNLTLGPVEDLSIAFYDHSHVGSMRVDFDANRERHAIADIADRQRQFLRMLGSIDAVDQAVGGLEVLSAAERRVLLEDWNATARPVPCSSVVDLFAAQAASTPDAVAVVHGERELSYAALDAQSNRLAHHLRGLGVGAETVVGLYVERSLETVVGLLGILKAGAAYLPLDPSYPAERLAFMLSDARCGVLVTQGALSGALAQRLPAAGGPRTLVRLDADWPAIARQQATAPALAIAPGQAAYVIYTSGSTGTPKGVVVGHGGIPNLAAAQIERFAITSDSRVLQFASPSFDAAMSEIATALLCGAMLVLPSDDRSADALSDLVIEQRVTHATLPPALLPSLSADLPLQSLIVAGEACSSEEVARWVPGRDVINAYGPTEATVCATMSEPLTGCEPSPPILVVRSGTRVFMFLDRGLRLFLRVLRVSFTFRVLALRGVIWGARA